MADPELDDAFHEEIRRLAARAERAEAALLELADVYGSKWWDIAETAGVTEKRAKQICNLVARIGDAGCDLPWPEVGLE